MSRRVLGEVIFGGMFILPLFNLGISFFVLYTLTEHFLLSLLASALSVTAAYAFRIYEPEFLESLNEQFVRLLVLSTVSAALVMLLGILNVFNVRYKEALQGFLIIFLTLPLLNYVLFNVIFLRLAKPKKYLVIGRKEEIKHILDETTEKSHGRLIFEDYINPVGIVLEKKLSRFDNILVANFELYESVRHILDPYEGTKKVEYLSDLSEKVLKRIPLEVLQLFKEYYVIQFENAHESPAKRVFDILGAIAGMLICFPVVLIVAAAILIEDGRPVIFKQLRVG